jgi:hypothetical protein
VFPHLGYACRTWFLSVATPQHTVYIAVHTCCPPCSPDSNACTAPHLDWTIMVLSTWKDAGMCRPREYPPASCISFSIGLCPVSGTRRGTPLSSSPVPQVPKFVTLALHISYLLLLVIAFLSDSSRGTINSSFCQAAHRASPRSLSVGDHQNLNFC